VWILAFALGLTLAMCGARPNEEAARRFVVLLPDGWQHASEVRLVIEGVRVPANQPLKLRVTMVLNDGREIVLGSVGIPALRRGSDEIHRLPVAQLEIAGKLRQLARQEPHAQELKLDIQAVEGHNNVIRDISWSVDTVRLETRAD
jgi:hypothetical protein